MKVRVISGLFILFVLFLPLSGISYHAGIGVVGMHGNPGFSFSFDGIFKIKDVPGLYVNTGARMGVNSYTYTYQDNFLVTHQESTIGSLLSIHIGLQYYIYGLVEKNMVVPYVGIAPHFGFFVSEEKSSLFFFPELEIGGLFYKQFFMELVVSNPIFFTVGITF